MMTPQLKQLVEKDTESTAYVLSYSGGKDSTVVAHLMYNAAKERLIKGKIYVVTVDTGAELPLANDNLLKSLEEMRLGACRDQIDLETVVLHTPPNKTFWGMLIGRGAGAPTALNRWCTKEMKGVLLDKFRIGLKHKHPRVIGVDGRRRAESARRARAISKTESANDGNATISIAADYTDEDVWKLLRNTPPPWGGSYDRLLELYRLLDNGRTGCWCCTVISRNKPLEAALKNGLDIAHLLDIRNLLYWSATPEGREKTRTHLRTDFQMSWQKNGNKIPDHLATEPTGGCYTMEFRKRILREVIKYDLIPLEVLETIREDWRINHGDWEDSVSSIYCEVKGVGIPLPPVVNKLAKDQLQLVFSSCTYPVLAMQLLEADSPKMAQQYLNRELRPVGEIIEERLGIIEFLRKIPEASAKNFIKNKTKLRSVQNLLLTYSELQKIGLGSELPNFIRNAVKKEIAKSF